jgi:hypothetical protein
MYMFFGFKGLRDLGPSTLVGNHLMLWDFGPYWISVVITVVMAMLLIYSALMG